MEVVMGRQEGEAGRGGGKGEGGGGMDLLEF